MKLSELIHLVDRSKENESEAGLDDFVIPMHLKKEDSNEQV